MATSFSALANQLNLLSSQAAVNAVRINASDAAGGIDIDCGTNGITIDSTTGVISLDTASTGASNFTVGGAAGTLTLSATGGGTNQVVLTSAGTGVNALRFNASDAAGGIDIDCGTNGITIDSTTGVISLDTASTGASNFTVGGAAGTLTLSATGGGTNQVVLTSAGTGANALRFNASDAAGGIDIDCGTNGITIDSTTGVISLDTASTGASNFTVAGAAGTLTLSATGGSTNQVILTSAGTGANAINMNSSAGGITLQTSSANRLLIGSGGLISFVAASNILLNGSAEGDATTTVVRTHTKAGITAATSVLRFSCPAVAHFAVVHIRMMTKDTTDTTPADGIYDTINGVASDLMIALGRRGTGNAFTAQLGAQTDVNLGAGIAGYTLSTTAATPGDASLTQTIDFQVATTPTTAVVLFAELKNGNATGITMTTQ